MCERRHRMSNELYLVSELFKQMIEGRKKGKEEKKEEFILR